MQKSLAPKWRYGILFMSKGNYHKERREVKILSPLIKNFKEKNFPGPERVQQE